MKTVKKAYLLFVICALVASASPGLCGMYDVVGLPFYDSVSRLNNMGQIAATIDNQAVIWTQAGGITQLGYLPGGTRSNGRDVNNLGHVAGYARSSAYSSGEAMYWDGSTMNGLGTLGGSVSYGYAINDGGAITGRSRNADNDYHAFLWTAAGGMTDLGTLGGEDSYGYSINNQNVVVGFSEIPDGTRHATLWDGDTMVDLGTLAVVGGRSEANAINDSNQVVGYSWYLDGIDPTQAFLWEDGTMTGLGFLGEGGNSEANDINAQGQVVGRSTITPTGGTTYNRAFLWEDGVMTNLNDLIEPDALETGWYLMEGVSINDNGQILCKTSNLTGDWQLVMLNPVPIPGAVWLLGSGLVGLAGIRRRRNA